MQKLRGHGDHKCHHEHRQNRSGFFVGQVYAESVTMNEISWPIFVVTLNESLITFQIRHFFKWN